MDIWNEFLLYVPTADTEAAAAIAHMTAPYGLYIEDYSDLEQGALQIAHSDLIDGELLARDRTRSVIHIYLPQMENPEEVVFFLKERLSAEKIPVDITVQSIREEDWADNWKQYFKPLPVGKRLLICPTWESVPVTDRAVLSLDPGMAFGTGGHHTTRLMLEAIEETLRPGDSFLDVGCGSGILSVAALLLGADRAVGVDIDPLAVKTAAENGRLNGFAPPQFTVLLGDLIDCVQGTYDIIAANIVADAILGLTPAVPAFLNTGGRYLVSGIIDTREQEVAAALSAHGFRVLERKADSGWICFVCAR